MKAIFRILGTAAAVAATGAAIVIMDKLLNEKAAPIIESIEFPEEAEKDDAEAAKTAEAYAEGEAKAEAEAAAPAEETAPAEEPAAPETEAAPAEAAEPVTLPDQSEERPVCDPEAPNPNPVEAGPAVAPKDENGKFDPTKIADVSDFGDWEEQVYGDNVFEKCGKGRDEVGDREKTRNFNGKTPLFRRERLCNYQQS